MERECPDSLNADNSHEFKLTANSLVTGGHGVMARCGYCGDLLQEYVIERVLNNALKPPSDQGTLPTAEAAVHLYNMATKGGNEGIGQAEFEMDDGGRVIVLAEEQDFASDTEEHLE